MFCPICHEPNTASAASCRTCEARLPERRRIFSGKQFVLLNADHNNPIAVDLDGVPVTVFEPTLISLYCHAVAFGHPREGIGAYLVGPDLYDTFEFSLSDRSRLDPPRLDLTAVVTERRIYRPGDEAHIFIVAPEHPGGEVEVEVRLADQQIMREKVSLNGSGLALVPYTDLEEGEYTVRVRRSESGKVAECRFSVAEFTLWYLLTLVPLFAVSWLFISYNKKKKRKFF